MKCPQKWAIALDVNPPDVPIAAVQLSRRVGSGHLELGWKSGAPYRAGLFDELGTRSPISLCSIFEKQGFLTTSRDLSSPGDAASVIPITLVAEPEAPASDLCAVAARAVRSKGSYRDVGCGSPSARRPDSWSDFHFSASMGSDSEVHPWQHERAGVYTEATFPFRPLAHGTPGTLSTPCSTACGRNGLS